MRGNAAWCFVGEVVCCLSQRLNRYIFQRQQTYFAMRKNSSESCLEFLRIQSVLLQIREMAEQNWGYQVDYGSINGNEK